MQIIESRLHKTDLVCSIENNQNKMTEGQIERRKFGPICSEGGYITVFVRPQLFKQWRVDNAIL